MVFPMDLKQLEQFVAVSREGGFAPASRVLYVSQPTLTRNIAALETSLRANLFRRSAKGAVLTEDGKKLLPHALSILQEAERARAEFSEVISSEAAQVCVGVSPNLLFDVLPDALGELLVANPDVKIVVSTGTYESLSQGLRDRELEFALCIVPETLPPQSNADFVLEEIGAEQVVPVARIDHEVFASPATLASVGGYRWVIPHQISLSYRFESAFFRRGLPLPVQCINSSSMSLIHKAVIDWGLIGMLPRTLLSDLGGGQLRELQVPELVMRYAVILVSNRAGTLPPVALTLAAALRRAGEERSVSRRDDPALLAT